jgi:hypothetical protein
VVCLEWLEITYLKKNNLLGKLYAENYIFMRQIIGTTQSDPHSRPQVRAQTMSNGLFELKVAFRKLNFCLTYRLTNRKRGKGEITIYWFLTMASAMAKRTLYNAIYPLQRISLHIHLK